MDKPYNLPVPQFSSVSAVGIKYINSYADTRAFLAHNLYYVKCLQVFKNRLKTEQCSLFSSSNASHKNARFNNCIWLFFNEKKKLLRDTIELGSMRDKISKKQDKLFSK